VTEKSTQYSYFIATMISSKLLTESIWGFKRMQPGVFQLSESQCLLWRLPVEADIEMGRF
jgi:hypothetical protein